MLILISPAKTLDYQSPLATTRYTQPELLEYSQQLIGIARKLTAPQIGKLMSISDKLADLNATRFHDWHPDFTPQNARQAILAFKGDVYTGLQAETLTEDDFDFAQRHLRMLSGLERKRWPTAIIAFNDQMALGAIKQLKQMGLRLPEDMAIIGCDNQFFCPYTDPPLTSIDLHPEEMTQSAVRELLVAREGNRTQSFSMMREATLIVRESCGAKLGYRKRS